MEREMRQNVTEISRLTLKLKCEYANAYAQTFVETFLHIRLYKHVFRPG